MLNIDNEGMVRGTARVIARRFPQLERGPMAIVRGIIVHQTDASTAQATFNRSKQRELAMNMSQCKPAALMLSLVMSFGAGAEQNEADHTVVHTYPMAKVASIKVNAPSVRADYGHNSMDCSNFKLTERNVRYFLRHAKPVSYDEYFHLLTWAECRGEGEITFANGDVAAFEIEAWGRGNLSVKSGKNVGTVYYFSCGPCDGFGVRGAKGAR